MRDWLVLIPLASFLLPGALVFAVHDRHADAPGPPPAARLVSLGESAYFLGGAGHWSAAESGLWTTYGTASGTRLVRSLVSLGGYNPAFGLVAAGKRLFFAGNGGPDIYVWASDGTPEGTAAIAYLYSSWEAPWTPGPLFAFGGRVWFQAAPWDGVELWVSDGTENGTDLFMDINPGAGDSSPDDFAALGNRFYYRADDGVHGAELWTSDGTAEGTAMAVDIRPGPGSSAPDRITPSGPAVYFTADDGRTGRELWRSDRAAK
jgi:ELWxxDGT repeat protein